jgi:molecular chaperone HtpG
MSAMGGGMNFYGQMPAMYTITVNMQNPLVARIMASKAAEVAPAQVIPDAAEDASEDVKRTVAEAQETAAAAHKADLEAFAGDNEILRQITDLALLANGMLKGKELSEFIARSAKVVEDAYLK